MFALVFLLIIQLVRPSMTNPPVDPARTIHAAVSLDPVVASVFVRSCNDCHSNATVWPWYSNVAPASWVVAGDVNKGRKALNFSEWRSLPPERQQKELGEICSEVTEREMPAAPYLVMHPRARLTGAEVRSICSWTRSIGQSFSEEAENE